MYIYIIGNNFSMAVPVLPLLSPLSPLCPLLYNNNNKTRGETAEAVLLEIFFVFCRNVF
jgi:hypothetical protein